MSFWFRDIISEATYLGNHTMAVQKGLNTGILLFIVSEAFFFLGIFWALYHSALGPTHEVGSDWPPVGIITVNPYELPAFNTVLLLSSGVTITYAHHSLIGTYAKGVFWGLIITIILAIIFTACQGIEYSASLFTISDGIFGSNFYFGTGFHGLHVLIGTAFIGVGLQRFLSYNITSHHHVGFESAILYWHFVDIVWLMLYISLYYWAS